MNYNTSIAAPAGFHRDSAAALDNRTLVNTVNEINNIIFPYKGMLVYCVGTDKLYKIDSINEDTEKVAHYSELLPMATASTSSTTGNAGFISAADLTKLNSIASGAEVNKIESIKLGAESSSLTITDKKVTIPLAVAPSTSDTNGTPGLITGNEKASIAKIAALEDKLTRIITILGNLYDSSSDATATNNEDKILDVSQL